jgi:hypothetical protein
LIALPEWDPVAYQDHQNRHLALLTERWGIRPVAESPVPSSVRQIP